MERRMSDIFKTDLSMYMNIPKHNTFKRLYKKK